MKVYLFYNLIYNIVLKYLQNITDHNQKLNSCSSSIDYTSWTYTKQSI